LQDFQHDGLQYVLRFQGKGCKSREIPVRHDLERYILAWLDATGIRAEAKDRPLFRSTLRRTGQLTGNPMASKSICELVKRRLKDAGLPVRLSPHSFRVTAITEPAHPGGPPGGCAIPRWAFGAANDGTL
jgi:integrase/recombinase XerD